jgi:ABC-type lipoprotein export system ATPase subunit
VCGGMARGRIATEPEQSAEAGPSGARIRLAGARRSYRRADEPSTHQDADHGRAVFGALRAAADRGAIVVVASHDPDGLRYADRVLAMSDGELSEIARR